MQYEHVYSHHDGSAYACLMDGWPVVYVDMSQRIGNQQMGHFPAHAGVYQAALRALNAVREICCYQGGFFVKVDGTWEPVLSAEDAYLKLERMVTFCAADTPDALREPQVAGRAADLQDTREVLRHVAHVRVWPCPEKLGKYFVKRDDKSIPDVAGFLPHPVVGTSDHNWLSIANPALVPVDPRYPHLHALFSAFKLDEASHAALHMHLIGAFHARSLDRERPILLVDSWCRGRGKSEVSNAINYVLSGIEEGITLKNNRDEMKDELLAYLGKGVRVVVVHNIEISRPSWNNDLLASLVSDGAIGGRMKYGKLSTCFRGVLPIINTVYGAASLHRDIVDRSFRVELAGAACRLNPRPIEYAREHRWEIVSEILAAYQATEGSPGWDRNVTRVGPFERVSAPVYAHVFNLSCEEVCARLETMMKGRLALEQPVMLSLFQDCCKAFESPNENILKVSAIRRDLAPPPQGATALGLIAFNGHWIDKATFAGKKE